MQRFYTACIAMLNLAQAVQITMDPQPTTESVGALQPDDPVNNDFHLVASEGNEMMSFIEWCNEFDMDFADQAANTAAFENWKLNNQHIKEFNEEQDAKNLHNPAKMNHNRYSAMSEEELEKHLGMMEANVGDAEQITLVQTQGSGMTADTYDHTQHTLPVEDQGFCGSCWAFAGNTVLMGTVAAKGGNQVRLSSQYAVDCGPLSSGMDGCNGGNSKGMWDWYKTAGVVDDDDYPYTSGDTGRVGECQSIDSRPMVIQTRTLTTEDEVLTALQTQPLVGHFAVWSPMFSFYSFGMIRPGDYQCWPNGTPNHSMAIVGVDLIGEGQTVTVEQRQLYARYRNSYDPDGGCLGDDEFIHDHYPMYCMWYETHYVDKVFPSGQYYKVQNSWGADWGHVGFAYFEKVDLDEHPDGNCSMFKEGYGVFQVDVEL